MKVILLVIGLFVMCFSYGKTVTVEEAKLVGEHFLSSKIEDNMKSSRMISLIEVGNVGLNLKSTGMEDPSFYFFNEEKSGFVIVAGDDCARPILGYSMHGKLDGLVLPDAFVEMLETYREEIAYARENQQDNTSFEKVWAELKTGEVKTKSTGMSSAVTPMLTTSWNQRPYYNALCPQDPESGHHAVTGCVATALAQILNYYEHPAKAEGYFSYIENDFGLQNVLFFNADYDWNKMPDVLNGSSPDEEQFALAELMYHCGVGVRMNYGLAQSGATMGAIRNALTNYFAYDNSLEIRSKGSKTFPEWELEVQAELDAGRPILYAGFGKGSGHAFILDGYASDQFHINWGWGGSSDGYFALTALNPGAYPSGFNAWQMGIFGVKPRTNYKRSDIELNKMLSFQSDTIYNLSPCDVTFDIKNNSVEEFNGYVSLILFDKDTVEVGYIGAKYGLKLAQGETLGDDTLLHINKLYVQPGAYLAALLYRENGNFIDVDPGNFTNFVKIQVASSVGAGDLFLTDSVVLMDSVPVTGDSLKVMLNVANGGASVYNGEVRAEVYNSWGGQVAILDSIDISGLNPSDTTSLVLFVDTLDLYPGRYYLRLFEKPEGQAYHLELNSKQFLNPLPFVVIPVPPKADKYENNDSIEIATVVFLEQNGSYFTKTIDSASIHVDEDKDFYEFVMPEGPYTYTAWINLSNLGGRDKGNDQEGGSSLHMLAHLNGTTLGPWENYSDEPILMNAGDTLRVEVFPFFLGLTGDYTLYLSVNQTVITSAEEKPEEKLKIYPNPAIETINVSSGKTMTSFDVFSLAGELVYHNKILTKSVQLDLQSWNKGTYLMKINFEDGSKELKKVRIM